MDNIESWKKYSKKIYPTIPMQSFKGPINNNLINNSFIKRMTAGWQMQKPIHHVTSGLKKRIHR